ncbi:uncharacterized protein [Heptranchias perlo]|uniref:uncharacterized protein isoform X1 n=1 Tax=Heptranchias perlo TaxID=212740 RepID=UPI00355A5CDB
MSEAECKQWILDTIDSLRSRKARPDLERICKMVQRRHGLAPSRTRRQLERLLRSRTVLRVSYKGSHSYRNAAKWHSGRDKGSGQGAGAPGAPARDKPRLQTEQQQQRRQQRDSGGGGGGSVLTRARLKGVLEQQVARGRSRNPRGGESEPPDRRRMRRRRLPVTAAPTDRKKTRRSKEADPSDREGSDEETATPLKNHDSARPTSSEAQNGVEPLTDCVSEEPDAEECPIKPPTTEDVEELPADQRVETSSAVEQSPSRCPSTECKGDIDDKMELDVEDLQTVPERVCPGDAGAVGSSEVPTPIEEGSNEEWSQEPCTNQDTQEHVVAPSKDEGDTEATPSLDLTLASTSSETDTARPLEARLEEGSAHGERPGTSAQEPGRRERILQVPAHQRARSLTSSAAEESDADFDGPGYRRRLMGVHQQMLGALENLPESLRTMKRATEESSSNLAQGFAQSLERILSNVERVVTSISAPVEPTMMQRLMTDVTASSAAQTSAIQSLTAALEAQTAAIVALGTTVERGFQGVTAIRSPADHQDC